MEIFYLICSVKEIKNIGIMKTFHLVHLLIREKCMMVINVKHNEHFFLEN